MKTACPNCGGEVEFRYDDSFVRVCPFCRASVLRTDRGVESLGQFADLVPFDSPLALFAGGTLGHESFLLVGMAQLRQGTGGLSQEWYAKFDGRWGWLAEGQGRYYLTFEVPDAQQLPRFEELVPGEQMQLPHQQAAYTVGERGQATYMSATGELPFRLPAGQTYRFADLSDGAGAFATIDYGDGSEPPTLYEGRQVTLAELGISGGEVAPADKPISSTKITCPSCGAPVEIRAPGQSLRVACAYCNALIDLDSPALNFGKLTLKATPSIPLGSKGTFADGEMTLIGYLSRSANVDGSWYTFEEYLLHAPAVGFRWLVNSDGHWSYVQPIAPGVVEYAGSGAKYDGVKFKLFQSATNLRVDTVLGEMYWRVQVGEIVTGEDFIAPPAMLSREATSNEENWSLSSYLTVKQVQHAFGNKDLPLGTPIGVGANQPYGIHGFSFVSSIAFVALIVVAIVAATMAKGKVHYSHTVTVPKTAPAAGTPAAVVDPCTELDPLLAKVDACTEINYTDKSMFRINVDMAKTMTTSLPSDKSCATLRDDMTAALHACDVKKEPVNVPVDAPPVVNPCADYATYAQSLSACPKFSASAKATLKRNVDRLKPKLAGKPTTGEKAACKGALDAAHAAAKKAACTVDEPAPPTTATKSTHDSCVDYDAAMKQLLACDKLTPASRTSLRVVLEAKTASGGATEAARQANCQAALGQINDAASSAGCSTSSTATTPPATPDATAEPPGSTFFSDPFELAGNENIEVDVSAPGLNNDWVYFAADLVEDKTGQVVTFDDNIEYYSGIDDGESWDEGSHSTDQVIPPVHGGSYVLRLESQHGGAGDQLIEVTVKQGIFRWRYFWLAVLVLGLPYFIFGLHEWSFEKNRWDNSSAGRSGAPKTFASLVLTIFGGVFVLIWAVISSMGSSDD